MGIPELWRLIDKTTPPVGEVRALADLSTEYFQKHGRPMRIAIDEAGWRFKNLTDAQVAFIRTKEPRANPIEKAIMWRLLRLMRLNIQLIFIFDGPARPWKRDKTAGRIDYEKIRLLVQLLDRLRIPHHRAPAEAEAECARMQQLGIVDAVWSDDADALMFGCTMLIRDHRPKDAKKSDNKKDVKLVEVYQAAAIEQRLGLNQAGILMFVMLVGGDYNAKGLEGCGPVAALDAVRSQSGRLANDGWKTPVKQNDLNMWALELASYFQDECSRRVQVPPGFPRELHFKNYRHPKVSSDAEMQALNGLRRGWFLPIDEAKLRSFFQERFNIWTKGYLKHVMPALLIKSLVATEKGEEERNLRYQISVQPRRGKQAMEDTKEIKINFLAHAVSNLDLLTEPKDSEDWSILKGEKGDAFDPSLPIEAEIVESILVHGLGRQKYDELAAFASKPQSKKRKQEASEVDAETNVVAQSSKKRKQQASEAGESADAQPVKKPRGRKATKKDEGTSEAEGSTKKSPKNAGGDIGTTSIPSTVSKPAQPATSFRMPTGWTPSSGSTMIPVLDLDHETEPAARPLDLTKSTPDRPSQSIRRGVVQHEKLQTANLVSDLHETELPIMIADNDEYNDGENVYTTQLSYQTAQDHDPDLAEAIRLSLLEASAMKPAVDQQMSCLAKEPALSESRPAIPLSGFEGPTLDREAIARARLAHLNNKQIAVQMPVPSAAMIPLKAGVPSQSGGLDIIDLTDD